MSRVKIYVLESGSGCRDESLSLANHVGGQAAAVGVDEFQYGQEDGGLDVRED